MRKEVELALLPGALFGDDPRGLLQYLGLNGRRLGNGGWSVWPLDDNGFVRFRDLADESEFPNCFDHLKHVPDPGIPLDDPDIGRRFTELQEQLAERMGSGSDIAAPFHRIQADVTRSTTGEELIGIVRDAYENIRQIPVADTGKLAFPHSTAHLISSTDLLIRRARLPGVIFALIKTPTP